MAYTKQTWATGDVVTANKLNHMEDGIAEGGTGGGDVLVVPVTVAIVDDAPTLTTSVAVADVITATETGKAVLYAIYFPLNGMYEVITSYEIVDGSVGFTFSGSTVVHDADGIHIEENSH